VSVSLPSAQSGALTLPYDPEAFHVYDTTLRDGTQQEGLSLSVADKLTVARHLDDLGVGFIEGGWPGSNPKDAEFFARATSEPRCWRPRRRWSAWSPRATCATSSVRCAPRAPKTSR
jgi:isopropylmalate/homocitrate/citramalate synthase